MKDILDIWASIIAIVIGIGTIINWLLKGKNALYVAIAVLVIEIFFITWELHKPQNIYFSIPIPTETPNWDVDFTFNVSSYTPTPVGDFSFDPVEPTISTLVLSPEQAIRKYFKLIEDKQYSKAWDMYYVYAGNENQSFDLYVTEWERSGPATIIDLNSIENSQEAKVTVTLYFPKKDITYKPIKYELIYDESRGNQDFGYWIFTDHTSIP
jgi:hypothetical protein